MPGHGLIAPEGGPVDDNALLGSVIRTLGAAWRAQRLYPPSSPLPLEAAEAACKAVDEYLQLEPTLRLVVAREGFTIRGLEELFAAPGIPELVDALGTHGIAELHFVAPPMGEEVVAFLVAAALPPVELRTRGGMQAVLTEAGTGAVKVVAVALAASEAPIEIPEEDADKFLAELAGDPQRLAIWLRAMVTYDDEGLCEGLLELARVAKDLQAFGRSLAEAFLEQETDGKDRLLEVAIELEPVRHILIEMLANLTPSDITAAIRGGRYGENPMSVSWAVAGLPIGSRSEDLVQEMSAALGAADRPDAEVALMRRMVGVRRVASPEQPLVAAKPAYGQILEAAKLTPEHVRVSKSEVSSRRMLDLQAADTIVSLLDTSLDLELFTSVLVALARAVPHLLESGDPELALKVLNDLSGKAVGSAKDWPELNARVMQATQEACGPRSMEALVAAYASDEGAAEFAAQLVMLGGEAAARALADAAMSSPNDDAMRCAEAVLGRRLPELLAMEVARAEARHSGKLAEVFARDGSPGCIRALEHLVTRPEDKVRAGTARGIVAAGGRAVAAYMPRLLHDDSVEVAMVAARALGEDGGDEAVRVLAGRLEALDGDNDKTVAREVVLALARSPSDAAEQALRDLAERRTIIRRGRLAEVKQLARQALAARAERGGE